MKRAIVTGIGTISAAGAGVERLYAAMEANSSAIRQLSVLSPGRYRHALAGEIEQAVWDGPPERRCQDIARLAAVEALADAGLDTRGRRPLSILLGTAAGEMLATERSYSAAQEHSEYRHETLLATAAWVTSRLAVDLGVAGPQFTFQNACSAGATAIAQAAQMIRTGAVDAALAGGAEVLSVTTFSGFDSLRALSGEACRPFDDERDGTVLGEGAAFLVIESEEAAKARGARHVAVIRGAGFSCDAYHRTRPDPEGTGAGMAMRRALIDGNMQTGDVGYISTHGTATKLNDTAELRSIAGVFGERASSLPISSLKGMTGHCIGASGAIEAAACCLTVERGFMPGTAGLRKPETEFGDWRILREPEGSPVDCVLSNSFAFGGNNASLLITGTGG